MAGKKDSVRIHLGIEITPDKYIRIFVGGKLYLSYQPDNFGFTDASYVGVGFIGSCGTEFSNYKFTPAQTNGFTINDDGSYVSNAKTCAVTVQKMYDANGNPTKYGLWESDVTLDRDALNSALFGLTINAYTPSSSGIMSYANSEVNGYYLHHNPKDADGTAGGNVNFRVVKLTNGEQNYLGSSAVLTYAEKGATTDAGFILPTSNAAYDEVKAYWAENNAVYAGTDADGLVTVRLGIEVTPDKYIRIYVGGALYFSYKPAEFAFVDDETCIGVGFIGSWGVKFSNYKFTPAQTNGFTINNDGSYVANESKCAVTVQKMYDANGNLTEYGLWESDVTLDRNALNSAAFGLMINAYTPSVSGVLSYTNSEVNGYYLHHNPKDADGSNSGNVNFRVVKLTNGEQDYSQSVLTYANIGATTDDGFTLSKDNAAYDAVKKYWQENNAVYAGTADSVTVHLGIEMTTDGYINIYVGGALYLSYKPAELAFKDDDTCIGVGFIGSCGVVFSNYQFTPSVAA